MSQLIVNQDGISNFEGVFYNPSNIDATYIDFVPNVLNICKLTQGSGAYYKYVSFWLRFQLNLDVNVTLESAYLRFTLPYGWPDSFSSGSSADPDWTAKIVAHKSLNSSGPASHSDAVTLSGASATTAYVNWTSQRYGVGATIFTPDIKSILREILDQPSWASGGHVTLFFTPYLPAVSDPRSTRFGYITNEKFQTDNPTWSIAPWILDEESRPNLIVNYEVDTPLPGTYDQYIESVLEIEHFYHGTTGKEEVNHTLTIEQDIVGVRDHVRSVFDTLEIIQSYKQVLPYSLEVTDYLFISQIVEKSVARAFTVENTVTVTQDIIGQTKFDKTVIHTLTTENDDVSYDRAYSREIEDTVVFEQDVISNIKTKSIIHGVRVEHSVATDGSVISAIELVHTLSIEQDIDYNRVGTRGTEHTLAIVQSVVGYFEERAGCERLDVNYHPFADSSVSFPTEPTLTTPSTITLACPPDSPTTSIELPIPLFGDREELLLTRIQRQTRGGVLKTFSSSVWPKVRTFRYKFDSLTTDKLVEMFTFLGATLGLQIRLTDHEGRLWDGYIVNPQGEASQFMRQCGNTTEFDFEGVEV